MAFITFSSIQSVGTGLTVLWALKSVSMYHSWTLDELVQDVASSPMLLNENGIKYWKEVILSPYTDLGPIKKRAAIRLHVVTTCLIATGLGLQFIKTIRRNNTNVHRWVGRATILLSFLSYPSFVKLLGDFPNQTGRYSMYPLLIGIPTFGVKGWLAIRNGNISEHRANMIMFAACFYFVGVSRLIMMFMTFIHSGPWAKHMGLGHASEWSEEDVADCFGLSIAFSLHVTFGVAAYQAYYLPEKSKGA